jgi:hypothetical protein
MRNELIPLRFNDVFARALLSADVTRERGAFSNSKQLSEYQAVFATKKPRGVATIQVSR